MIHGHHGTARPPTLARIPMRGRKGHGIRPEQGRRRSQRQGTPQSRTGCLAFLPYTAPPIRCSLPLTDVGRRVGICTAIRRGKPMGIKNAAAAIPKNALFSPAKKCVYFCIITATKNTCQNKKCEKQDTGKPMKILCRPYILIYMEENFSIFCPSDRTECYREIR